MELGHRTHRDARPGSRRHLQRRTQNDHARDAPKYAYAAEAARPEAKSKQQYSGDYLHNPFRPEDWIAQSLGEFNYWNQSALTEPYLRPSLEALAEIKRHILSDRMVECVSGGTTIDVRPSRGA